MNCQDIREQLHPYLDGELDSALSAQLERGLEDCPDCRAELEELRALRLMARAAFEGPAKEVDLSHMAGDVMARLASEGALRGVEVAEESAERERSFVDWLTSLFTFEQPLVSLAAFALALIAIAAVAFNASTTTEAQGPAIASPAESASPSESIANSKPSIPSLERRSPPTLVEKRHEAFVEHVEAAKGRVVVDDNADDPSKPIVVWHHLDEGGAMPVEGATSGQEL